MWVVIPLTFLLFMVFNFALQLPSLGQETTLFSAISKIGPLVEKRTTNNFSNSNSLPILLPLILKVIVSR